MELGSKLELGALIILRTRTKPEPRSWLFKNQNWDLDFLRTGTRTEISVFWKLEPESDLGIDSYMTEARSKRKSKKFLEPRQNQDLKQKPTRSESQARVKSQKQKQETKSWSEKREIEAKKMRDRNMRDKSEKWKADAKNER